MSEEVLDTSHLPVKVGQEVICRKGSGEGVGGEMREEKVENSLCGLETHTDLRLKKLKS
uniref:Uncharacterized protein n=1 Tax=Anguilla anguilla TaxID=7936 RepID=A0A0E9T3Q1_ANGAN